jgi:hypothetical protein
VWRRVCARGLLQSGVRACVCAPRARARSQLLLVDLCERLDSATLAASHQLLLDEFQRRLIGGLLQPSGGVRWFALTVMRQRSGPTGQGRLLAPGSRRQAGAAHALPGLHDAALVLECVSPGQLPYKQRFLDAHEGRWWWFERRELEARRPPFLYLPLGCSKPPIQAGCVSDGAHTARPGSTAAPRRARAPGGGLNGVNPRRRGLHCFVCIEFPVKNKGEDKACSLTGTSAGRGGQPVAGQPPCAPEQHAVGRPLTFRPLIKLQTPSEAVVITLFEKPDQIAQCCHSKRAGADRSSTPGRL